MISALDAGETRTGCGARFGMPQWVPGHRVENIRADADTNLSKGHTMKKPIAFLLFPVTFLLALVGALLEPTFVGEVAWLWWVVATLGGFTVAGSILRKARRRVMKPTAIAPLTKKRALRHDLRRRPYTWLLHRSRQVRLPRGAAYAAWSRIPV